MSSAKESPDPQPETLVQNVVKALITYIRDNQLRVGDPILSEGEFGQLLNVSRTVVREAFKALAAMNIIEVSSGRRARVHAFDGSVMALTLSHGLRTQQVTVQQIWDIRRSIEMRAVALACMHRSERTARRLEELAGLMRETHGDIATMTEHDIEFHLTIAEATRNPLYPVLISSLTSAMRETNPIVWQARTKPEERLAVMDWHAAIADAIAARDTAKATEALSRHFDEALRGLVNSGFN
ncbi:FadR/GntR family transcriptional regulator [Kineobactrum salinum]|uniref:FadR family transcriptional regulator n=1 Tax=Kineobactrum salinum TaxID=2708301 RepID=A0A6C0U5F5_9GAMM|nr:FCD domain-containing protein [Kineobactrum salinum]QIB67390.1 FadR family transcriptional regulator [Kineobactrum salinum]